MRPRRTLPKNRRRPSALVAGGLRGRRRRAPPRCSSTSSSASRRRRTRSSASSSSTDDTEDPGVWGKNFPLQYDGYKRTVDMDRTRYGGSEAVPRTPTQADPRSVVAQSRLEEDPRLKTMWAGYAFATDFREERGHAYMLDDQTFTERQQVTKQPGTCIHCHALGVRAVQEARRTAT